MHMVIFVQACQLCVLVPLFVTNEATESPNAAAFLLLTGMLLIESCAYSRDVPHILPNKDAEFKRRCVIL